MDTIGALLTRDLRRKIEEIIQVDQADEQSVHEEITEYIATDSIRDQYAEVLTAIADAPADPHEGVGVWISGFFGSGKSSFAKNLGYALQHDKTVMGESFATLFKQQIGDARVSNLLDSITTRMPTDVILFEVAKERDTRKVTERIAELMYTVLLRELDYAEDFDIAELEIELEAEGKLDEFVAICQTLYPQGWRITRKGAQKLSRASAVLHNLDPITYPSADSWSHAQRHRDAAITVSKVVERTFELMDRRRPGKALIFIIDEVGQHVARSGDKIEDLRATVEEFGKIGKNLLRARKIPAPCWVVVTSQEKLDEVVAAIDARRVDIAKLQDRFRSRVDLAPSDIREVATKRVLAKKPEAEPMLQHLFASNQGVLNAALRLERTSRRTEITASDFIQFYPYPPHYIELCIGIMSGIRLQPGAPRHYGGSNRTMEMVKRLAEVRVESRQPAHQHDVYWVWALTPEIDELVAQVHASRTMVEKYDQLRAQNKITPEEASCLQDEKNAVFTHQSRLQDKLTQAMEQGTGLFRGVAWDAASLGKNLSEILKKLLGIVVPDLYPKLDLGARPLKGDEAELLLKTVDLKALPQVFYAGEHSLGLVVQDGAKLVPNPAADVAKEVLDYLVSEHSYGNKDTRTGRALERRFGGMGYGWDRDMLRLILALLFRAGSIEVTYQGNRFRNYQDPLSRVPFINNVAFRTSLFSPRDTLGLKTLTLAVQQLEDLTGEEVDVEEGAIATAFKKLAGEELEKLYPFKAAAEAYQLPVLPLLTDFQHTLVGIQSSTSDDCVRLLTETGELFQSIANASGRCVEHSMTPLSGVSEKPERRSTTWGPSWPLIRSLLTLVTIWKSCRRLSNRNSCWSSWTV